MIRGQVPEFNNNYDVRMVSIVVDGQQSEYIPEKDDYQVDVICDKGVGEWDYDNWKLSLSDFTRNTKCSVNFSKKETKIITLPLVYQHKSSTNVTQGTDSSTITITCKENECLAANSIASLSYKKDASKVLITLSDIGLKYENKKETNNSNFTLTMPIYYVHRSSANVSQGEDSAIITITCKDDICSGTNSNNTTSYRSNGSKLEVNPSNNITITYNE